MERFLNSKSILVFAILSFLLVIVAETASGEIILYGRKTCGLTIRMMKHLDEVQILYTFKDIDDSANRNEVREKLQKAGIRGSYMLPLMDINGVVKACPSFEEVKRLYQDTR